MAHHTAARLAEAEALYRQIIAAEPRHVDAWQYLGILALQTGRNAEAVTALLAAIAIAPAAPALHANLGEAYRRLGRLAEAGAALRRALALKPDFAEAHYNLGCTLADESRHAEATAAFSEAIRLQPGLAAAHSNLGNALREQGRLDEAIASYHRAIQLQPGFADAHANLGNALRDQGLREEAIAAYQQAIRLDPHHASACSNLGVAMREAGRFEEAVAACRRALSIQPDFAAAHNNLGVTLAEQGLVGDAIASFRRALELRPDFAEAHSNLLYHLHCLADGDPQAIFAEHQRWDEMHARPFGAQIVAHSSDRNPERRLRIGYVSPDFRNHPVAYFLESLLAAHDRSQFEVFCYSDVVREDEFTARLRAHADAWRPIAHRTDTEVAALVREDRVDILVDLAGHTAGNRLLVFARKPAPVQVTYLGYCDTTGLGTMDYRLTDSHADPPGGTEHLHSEQLVRLPDSAWCFRPADTAPPVQPPPVLREGHLTFGCFNARRKITTEALALWSRLLAAVPGARLLLRGPDNEESFVQPLRAALAAHGIAPDRLECIGRAPTLAAHLALYHRVDIALDTFPYNGTTTTCEALWMGVPVITIAGQTHASRVGVSLLTNAGLPELIAEDEDACLRIATRLTGETDRLAQFRASVREKLAASPLLDARRFGRNFEQTFRQMWRTWCSRG